MPIGQIVSRGFRASHSALLGALYVSLLQAPLQVLNAFAQGFQTGARPNPGQQPDPRIVLSLFQSCGSIVFALAVFFLFPVVQGGILGRLRDRLEAPDQAPGQLGAYGRTFYAPLLGSAGLFMLATIVLMLPAMCIGLGLAFQVGVNSMPALTGEGTQPSDSQQLTRQLLSHPIMLVALVAAAFLVSAASTVYWMANCIVVSEQEWVRAAWRRSVCFCRRNLSAVVVIWLLGLALGILISPLTLAGPLGFVKDARVLMGLALLYSAVLGYGCVLWAGVGMSLYLARRAWSEQPELAEG